MAHFNIEKAFAQSTLNGDINVRLPKGCGERSKSIVRVSKLLCGLRQIPRVYSKFLVSNVKGYGFDQSGTPMYVPIEEQMPSPEGQDDVGCACAWYHRRRFSCQS